MRLGIKSEAIKMIIPKTRTVTVLEPAPFHSFRRMPQTLLKVTFSDIRILQEKAIITLPSARKLLPNANPKNWEYQRIPAKAQNNRLLVNTFPGTLK